MGMLLKRHKKTKEQPKQEQKQDYSKLTKDEIKAILDDNNIEYKATNTKDELIDLMTNEKS